ncbi:single-stranded-DNA-specific exonuclease RecJ [Candidatus Saganbacteria bacterium CG08_land_8_20_14_0_20_45_16]|uniref:Single-stranded-DNA-specific exonuclease RecJ n=1 Tax=Candidatus Saganbacteria bacterium CG08_land_8_20_14_0_20_45_16 TaxID=2014293 RepID=A0A2H0XT67_UNCSA|nr:MAG: single-stranded-DNA-specific exonuclease RecJ [Candidatus Saganbacteria bacterium CG08_land_8_20_14_0_20_45_16]
MKLTWQLAQADPAQVEFLVKVLRVSPCLAKVLINRGLTDPKQVAEFFAPTINNLRDPKEIPGLIKAAERVLLAKQQGERVVVFGDYDVDGVSATAIMIETLKLLGIKTSYHIPHRHKEGYGLSIPVIEQLAASGAKLIITVDCGIANYAEIKRAADLGLEVIVTDHHNLPAKLPKAVAIVNPKMIEADHPSKELAGAGVAFKFAWGLLRLAGIKDSKFLISLLDLAALGTLADVVPLHLENRIIAVLGMRVINERTRLGIKALVQAASLPEQITVNNVYFSLAPRLNAAGRLEHAKLAAELLLTNDSVRASELASFLQQTNVKRQEIGDEIRAEVFAQINDQYLTNNRLVLLAGAGWHPGVIGITASKVVDEYFRPAVLVGVADGVGRGSARSVAGVNIFELLKSCADLFTHFGGHSGAAGFSILEDNLPELTVRLRETANQNISAYDLAPKLVLEAEISLVELSLSLVQQFAQLEPYGQGNSQPVFLSRNLKILDMKKVGKDGRHFKAKFCANDIILDTIAFSKGSWVDELSYDQTYDLAYRLEANEWNGFVNVQLSLVDIREAEPTR